MIKAREWPVRAMYILIAAALAISLFITAAPTHNVSANSNDVTSEWDRVSTPTTQDWVLSPESTIYDYAVNDGGDVAYAVVYSDYDMDCNGTAEGNCLLKSTDSAATWKDITKGVKKEIDKEDLGEIDELVAVACDPANPDFVAVDLDVWNGVVDTNHVFISNDGGLTFNDIGTVAIQEMYVYAFEVSPAVGGVNDIAIGGTNGTTALLFRCQVKGDLGDWDDATTYKGWDNINDGISANEITSAAVVDIKFIPGWSTLAEKTILVATATNTSVYLQIGSWGKNPAWNAVSTALLEAVPVVTGVTIPIDTLGGLVAGIAVPEDYSTADSETMVVWVNVNYYNGSVPVGEIFRVQDTSVSINQQVANKTVWLTNVSYRGTVSGGKAIAGVLGDGDPRGREGLYKGCCKGVDVYRVSNVKEMNICCPPGWTKACKPPTGVFAMEVFYVSENKAYAVALYDDEYYDEGAWSVSFDDGDTWNQLSLIDTDIDYLSDVAVSPNCNKMMLVSVNIQEKGDGESEYCGCDSVWLKATTLAEAEEYNGKWLRTWCGQLVGDNSRWFGVHTERGLLRLAPEEDNGDTVYLVDRMTDTVYWNEMEGLACWKKGTATVSEIVDLAVKDNKTIYALGANGDIAMSDNFANTASWTEEPVDSKVDEGWNIAVHYGNNATNVDVLVGGYDGQVSYSADGETFALVEEVPTIDGLVSVAFDSYFDTNQVIYAATAEITQQHENYGGGVYRWVIDESDKWKDLGAEDYNYTGLVVGRLGGNPMSKAATGGVLYASYVGPQYNSDLADADDWFDCWKSDNSWYTGVARCLTPAADISCEKCVEWDYLTVGLNGNEYFIMGPQALKVCGCMDATTNTKLFAIGTEEGYDMCKAKSGTVWTFEDCYAKKAPELLAPASNTTIPADCWCSNLPFSLKWDGVCDACHYDVQIALDREFTDTIYNWDYEEGGKYTLGATGLSFIVPDWLTCEVTYYWRVRAHQAQTCQVIHSWWSDVGTITVAPSTDQAKITLVAPVSGATDVPIQKPGFSWQLTASADKYDWTLSTNADLSAPIASQPGLTRTSCSYSGNLTASTTYYWQVIAYKAGTKISTSAVGVFTTAPAPTPTPITPPPSTPIWVWVVIAIGAVLVIVVIVLIFRTRRV